MTAHEAAAAVSMAIVKMAGGQASAGIDKLVLNLVVTPAGGEIRCRGEMTIACEQHINVDTAIAAQDSGETPTEEPVHVSLKASVPRYVAEQQQPLTAAEPVNPIVKLAESTDKPDAATAASDEASITSVPVKFKSDPLDDDGTWITKVLQYLNIKQSELAQLLDIDQSLMYRYKVGRDRIPQHVTIAIKILIGRKEQGLPLANSLHPMPAAVFNDALTKLHMTFQQVAEETGCGIKKALGFTNENHPIPGTIALFIADALNKLKTNPV